MRPANPKTSLRCAVYTRVSTEHGLEQEFNSLDNQREASEAYIKSQAHEGWRLMRDRYDDGGFSGGSMERPALKKLLDAVRARRIGLASLLRRRTASTFGRRCYQCSLPHGEVCSKWRLRQLDCPRRRQGNESETAIQTALARKTRSWAKSLGKPHQSAPGAGGAGNELPAYVANGVVGLRVRAMPLAAGLTLLSAYAGEHPQRLIEAIAVAPYPVAGLAEAARAVFLRARGDLATNPVVRHGSETPGCACSAGGQG